eukprot:gene17940-14033_t
MLKATATNAEGAAPVDFAVGIKSGDVKGLIAAVSELKTTANDQMTVWVNEDKAAKAAAKVAAADGGGGAGGGVKRAAEDSAAKAAKK